MRKYACMGWIVLFDETPDDSMQGPEPRIVPRALPFVPVTPVPFVPTMVSPEDNEPMENNMGEGSVCVCDVELPTGARCE